jgi:murein peptide amidase A
MQYPATRGRHALLTWAGYFILAVAASGCHPAAQNYPDPGADVLRHPELWSVVGTSVEGRPIYAHEQGTGEEAVLVIGSIHGDEAVTGQVVVKLVELISRERKDPLQGKVICVPVLNPDGVAQQRRTNAHGVDINRNFPTRNWSPMATEDRYPPGPAPSSEPETRLLLELLSKYRPRLIISVHAPLHVINYDGPAEGIADRMAALNGYRVSDSIGYATPGSLGTYAGVERQIPTITLELPRVLVDEAWEQNRDALMDALSLYLTN